MHRTDSGSPHSSVARAIQRMTEIQRELADRAQPPQLETLVTELGETLRATRAAVEELGQQEEVFERLSVRGGALAWQHERILLSLPVPALLTDAQGTIVFVNPAAAGLFGASVGAVLGTPVAKWFTPHDQHLLLRHLDGAGPLAARRMLTVSGAEGPRRVEASVAVDGAAGISWILIPLDPESEARRRWVLPDALRALAALPEGGGSTQEVLRSAANICADALGPHVHVSVNYGPPQSPELLGSSSSLAQAVDGAQVVAREGPCVTAFELRAAVTSRDLSSDDRWPGLAAQVRDLHPSALSAPIEVGERLVGALNVYGPTNDPRQPGMIDGALLLAATLGALFFELELGGEMARLNEDLRQALASRATIEQAKGVVMAEKHCSPDEAFAHLVALSSAGERKLRDVARDIVDSVSR